MNKILIIIEREFLKRIQKKSFIVLTIVSPLIMPRSSLCRFGSRRSRTTSSSMWPSSILGTILQGAEGDGDLPLHAGAKSQQRDA